MMNEKNFKKWLGRTAYQLMPDRFARDESVHIDNIPGRILKTWNDRMPNWQPDEKGEYLNNFYYGGNINGLKEKLRFLKILGFDMIYITPIEQSEEYHHYDVGDHETIDPWLGTWDDFRSLCNTAHKLDILVMVDLVFNHTGIHSRYITEHPDWYEDNNGQHTFWYGFKNLPTCNKFNKSYQDAMTEVIETYLKNGADGIRLDLAEIFPKEFLYALNRVKEKYPEAIFVGEMWDFAISDREEERKYSKVLDGELDSVMNYPIADAILRWVRWGEYRHFQYNFDRVYNMYPENVQNVLLNNVGTHDNPTTMTMLAGDKMNNDVLSRDRIWDIEGPWRKSDGSFDTYGFRKFEAEHDSLNDEEYELGKKLTKLAIAIMYTFPGIPCIFQGTEIAETGYKDPFNRKPYNWNSNESEMLDFVKNIGRYRHKNKDILASGKIKLVSIDAETMVLERYTDEGKKLFLIANRTDEERCSQIIINGQPEEIWVGPYSTIRLRTI